MCPLRGMMAILQGYAIPPEQYSQFSVLGNLKPMDDALPLDFGLLEIDRETERRAGGSQVVKTLRGVLVGEALHTFQLHQRHVFDEDIGKVFSDILALVSYSPAGQFD